MVVARSALHVGHLRVRRGASLLLAPQPRRLVGAGDLLLSVTTTTGAAPATECLSVCLFAATAAVIIIVWRLHSAHKRLWVCLWPEMQSAARSSRSKRTSARAELLESVRLWTDADYYYEDHVDNVWSIIISVLLNEGE